MNQTTFIEPEVSNVTDAASLPQCAAIAVRGLTVAYDAKPVLWNVDLDVPAGAMMGIVGPNGAGKSTLLKSMLGIVPRIAGRIEIDGRPVRRSGSQVGYVPQRSSVDWDFPTTVIDLVTMGTYGRLGWFRRPGKSQRAEAEAALDKVGLHELGSRQIGELSGGQQQRAFLARAFVQDAPICLLDEPFAGVDATTEKAIVRLLHDLRRTGKTIIVVHHDLTTVVDYFNYVTLLNRTVIGSGPVQDTFTNIALEKTYGGPMKNCGLDCGFGSGQTVSLKS